MNYTEQFNAPPSNRDLILNSAQGIQSNTSTIVNAIHTARQFANPGQKTILGVGELHANGLHIMQQIDVLYALRESGLNCATAIEWPPNNIDLHIEEIFKSKIAQKDALRSMMEAEENGPQRNRLSAQTEPIRSANARLSRALMHQFMEDRNIPVFCADAPRDWELFINCARKEQHLLASDPKAIDAIEKAIEMLNLSHDDDTTLQPIPSLRQLGMLARNIYTMNEVERILQQSPEIDVILLEAGRAHITGNETLKPEPSPYEHGLASLFAGRGNHTFISAPLYNSERDRIRNTPQQAFQNPQILWLNYLKKSSFNTIASATSDTAEAEHIQSLTPFLPFINGTLRGRSPQELYTERKNSLKVFLEVLSSNGGALDHVAGAPPHWPQITCTYEKGYRQTTGITTLPSNDR